MASNNRYRRDPRFNPNWEGRESRNSGYDRNFQDHQGYHDVNYNLNRDYDRYRRGEGFGDRENYGRPYSSHWDDQRSGRRYFDKERDDYGRSYNSSRDHWHNDRDFDRPGSVENYTGRFGNNFNRDGRGYRDDEEYQNREYDNDLEERGFWERTKDEVSSWFGDDEAERRRRMDRQQGEFRGKGPKGYRRSDERIREDVHDRLSDDSWVDASEIEVTVENGDVVLTGSVNSRYAKRRAEDIVEGISGVYNVENRLKVHQTNNTGIAAGMSQTVSANTSASDAARANPGHDERSKTLIPT